MFDKWAKDYVARHPVPTISKEAEARHKARHEQIMSQGDHLQYWVEVYSGRLSRATTDEQILKYTALLKDAEETLANYRIRRAADGPQQNFQDDIEHLKHLITKTDSTTAKLKYQTQLERLEDAIVIYKT